jgi:nucleoside-diphosphate-sugar epimerase
MKRKVFVTGGSGFLGRKLIRMLHEKGDHVIAMARSTESAEIVKQSGADEVCRADLDNESLSTRHLKGVDVVIHAAAYFKMWGPYKYFYQTNVTGTEKLLKVAKDAGVPTFIAIGAAGTVMGAPKAFTNIGDFEPLQFPNWAPYIKTKALAEKLVIEASAPGFRTTVIKPPLIWAADSHMIDNIFELVKKGRFSLIDHGDYKFSAAHAVNVCHAAIMASEMSESGTSYFVTDGRDYVFKDFFKEILVKKGMALPTRSVSFSFAWMIAPVIETVWKVFGIKSDPPLSRQMVRMIGKPFTLNIDRARKDFGYSPIVNFEQGVSEFANAGVK